MAAEKIQPVLDKTERHGATWLKIKKHYEARLAMLRAKNDSGRLDEIKTARQRGLIAEAKYILSLGEDEPAAAPDEDLFKD